MNMNRRSLFGLFAAACAAPRALFSGERKAAPLPVVPEVAPRVYDWLPPGYALVRADEGILAGTFVSYVGMGSDGVPLVRTADGSSMPAGFCHGNVDKHNYTIAQTEGDVTVRVVAS